MTVLKLDYDGAKLPPVEMRAQALCAVLYVRVTLIHYARTRRGWHVVICLARRISAPQIVAVQAIMGSDPMRELFNLARVRSLPRQHPCMRRDDNWNVLYSEHHRRIAF
ncbi:MAG: hypothetical protein WC729_30070 [Sphingomonas sp.]|jgi:hypothetical protein|uniref:hypothetical protein n=1 Tax=Sphingomonas sp. TaxID=28214 RepID=UPI003564F630